MHSDDDQQATVTPDMEAAAVIIQARLRGAADRRKLGQDKTPGKVSSVKLPNRQRGHPTDRQLIAQAVARKKAEDRKVNRIAESSFDGESTCHDVPVNKAKRPSTPPPDGLEHLTVLLSAPKDMQTAFSLLDETGSRALKRIQARAFLRCMGWIVTNAELDMMLNGGTPATGPRTRIIPDLWSLNSLQEILDRNSQQHNSSVDCVHEALLRLSNGKQRISKNRLIEVTVANTTFINDNIKDVLRHIGAGDMKTVDCRELAQNVCSRTAQPPPVVDKYSIKMVHDTPH